MRQYIKHKITEHLFHTKHSMTITQFGRMIDGENRSLIKRFKIWAPAKWQEEAYGLLMTQFADIISQNEVSRLMEDHYLQLNLYNKINSLLPSLYHCLYLKPQEKHLNFFREYFGKECMGAKDLNLIINEIKKLSAKYRELFPEKKIDETMETHKYNFVKLLVSLETALNRALPRDLLLYEIESYYQTALESVKQKENG